MQSIHSFTWIKLEFIRNLSDYLSCVLVITFQLFMKAACPPTYCSNNISMHVQGLLPCNFQNVNFILVASLQIRDNKKKALHGLATRNYICKYFVCKNCLFKWAKLHELARRAESGNCGIFNFILASIRASCSWVWVGMWKKCNQIQS